MTFVSDVCCCWSICVSQTHFVIPIGGCVVYRDCDITPLPVYVLRRQQESQHFIPNATSRYWLSPSPSWVNTRPLTWLNLPCQRVPSYTLIFPSAIGSQEIFYMILFKWLKGSIMKHTNQQLLFIHNITLNLFHIWLIFGLNSANTRL